MLTQHTYLFIFIFSHQLLFTVFESIYSVLFMSHKNASLQKKHTIVDSKSWKEY